MDTRTLVGEDRRRGLGPPLSDDESKDLAKLVENDQKAEAVAVFWWLEDEAEEYQFVVAYGDYEFRGPRKLYAIILDKLKLMDVDRKLPLTQVWVMPDSHPVLQTLRTICGSGRNIVITNCHVNGVTVREAIVLFIKKRRAGTRRLKR